MTDTTAAGSRPTVALVHGAFADSSSWNDVVEQLQAAGIAVQAISNPLRGISADAAYVASAIRQIPGPVLAVPGIVGPDTPACVALATLAPVLVPISVRAIFDLACV